jgi:hypothetical protein
MNKKDIELKLKYKCDFEIVQRIINEFDPCGLIQSGSPIDEYDHLSNQILRATYNGKTKAEIKEIILHEIEFNFGITDIETINEKHSINFFNELENLIEKIEKQVVNKPSH